MDSAEQMVAYRKAALEDMKDLALLIALCPDADLSDAMMGTLNAVIDHMNVATRAEREFFQELNSDLREIKSRIQ